eukprot:scpid66233/ scgid18823/ 
MTLSIDRHPQAKKGEVVSDSLRHAQVSTLATAITASGRALRGSVIIMMNAPGEDPTLVGSRLPDPFSAHAKRHAKTKRTTSNILRLRSQTQSKQPHSAAKNEASTRVVSTAGIIIFL